MSNKKGVSNADNVTNPFPNVITPAEVKELQDKTMSSRPPRNITKVFYTSFGKELNIANGKASGDTHVIPYNEVIRHQGMIGRIDAYIFIPRVKGASHAYADISPYKSIRENKNADGSLSFDNQNSTQTVIPYTLEVNGKIVDKDSTTKHTVEYYMGGQQTFIHVTTIVRKKDELIWGHAEVRYEAANHINVIFWILPQCGGEFHFVDDLKYRKTTNISGASDIPQRSAAEPDRFSTKPFTPLNIPDLIEAKTINKVPFLNNNEFNPYFAPLLNFEGDRQNRQVKRPTMEGLTGTKIPGYLYYSNDIDTPKGGEFTADNTENFGNYDYGIARDNDDNQLTTKHYYVTFRPIPTQLVVQYKDLKNSIESGKKYSIYSGNTLVSDTLTSSSNTPTAPTKAELQTMITDKNTALLSEAAGYFSGNNIYLAPGSYIVKPTAEAPENYEWVVDSTDIANAPTDKNINIAVHKDDNVFTQQVVTFVLRRKIATVTFFDGDDNKPYATVKVQKGSSIDGDELKNQSMPKDPTKPGFTFNGWFTGKDGKGAKFTGDTPVSGNISVHSSYISNPPAPTPEPEPEPTPTPEPEPDIDWDDIPDIDLTPDQEPEPTPTPVPDFPVPVAPAPILPPAEAEPEPAPAPSQPKQPEQQPKHVAKHLPKTGSTATPILASAIASLFAGLAGLAESFAANRKRRN